MPAAFATTPISRGDFVIGSATRRAVAPEEKQCALVRAKGRHRHTTSRPRPIRSCPQGRSRSSRRTKSRAGVRLLRNEIRRLSMTIQFSRRGMAARPARALKARSILVRRLVQARDDPGKQRIRAWLRELDDEQLASLGLTREDILVLRH